MVPSAAFGAGSVPGASIQMVETPDGLDPNSYRPAALSLAEISIATHQDAIGRARHDRYDVCNDYYEGRQRDPRTLTFDGNDLNRNRDFSSRHNLCAPVIDIQVERLTVSGFHLTTADAQRSQVTDDVSKLLWRWWQANRMDAKARMMHRRTFKFGDAYMLVEWDTEMNRPRYCLEDPRRIVPLFDPRTGALKVVYKAWAEVPAGDLVNASTQTRIRINKYQPGLIEKFVATTNTYRFDYYTEDTFADGTPDTGYIPYLDRQGRPLPIPIVHFKHIDDNEGNFGRSVLDDIIPMQDTFNLRTWVTSQAAVFDGARTRYMVNIQTTKDDAGVPRRWPLGANAMWQLNPEDPDKPFQVGTLEPGDPGRLQDTADRELKTIAGLLGIPMHLIWPEGGLPSGEALKTAEARLTSKLNDSTIMLGNSHEDVQYISIRLHNTFSNDPPIPEDLMISTTWESVESRSALIDEQVIASRADDLSWHQRMRERNYTAETIEQIEKEREEERRREQAQLPDVSAKTDNLSAGDDDESMMPERPDDDKEAA